MRNNLAGVAALFHTRIGKTIGSGAIALSALVVVVTIGANATLTKTTATDDGANVDPTFATGTLDLRFGDKSGANAERHTIDVGAINLVPGDTMQRVVNIHNDGSVDFASLVLDTTASVSSDLDTDTTNGLQLTVHRCDQAWTETGSNPYLYTCGGATSNIVSPAEPIIMTARSLGTAANTAGAVGHYRLTLSVPSASTIEGESSDIKFAFTATQRAATNR